jgi:hypothetical protein
MKRRELAAGPSIATRRASGLSALGFGLWADVWNYGFSRMMKKLVKRRFTTERTETTEELSLFFSAHSVASVVKEDTPQGR